MWDEQITAIIEGYCSVCSRRLDNIRQYQARQSTVQLVCTASHSNSYRMARDNIPADYNGCRCGFIGWHLHPPRQQRHNCGRSLMLLLLSSWIEFRWSMLLRPLLWHSLRASIHTACNPKCDYNAALSNVARPTQCLTNTRSTVGNISYVKTRQTQ